MRVPPRPRGLERCAEKLATKIMKPGCMLTVFDLKYQVPPIWFPGPDRERAEREGGEGERRARRREWEGCRLRHLLPPEKGLTAFTVNLRILVYLVIYDSG